VIELVVVVEAKRVVGVLDDVEELEGRAAACIAFEDSACKSVGVKASDPPLDTAPTAAFNAAAAAEAEAGAPVVSAAADPHLLPNTQPPTLPPIPPLVLLLPSIVGNDFLPPLFPCCPANIPPRYDALALLPPVSVPVPVTACGRCGLAYSACTAATLSATALALAEAAVEEDDDDEADTP
jgi:hypothetical protein